MRVLKTPPTAEIFSLRSVRIRCRDPAKHRPWLNPSARFARFETQVQRRGVAGLAPIRTDLAQALEQFGLDSWRRIPAASSTARAAQRSATRPSSPPKSSKNHAQLVSEACAARTISNSSIRRVAVALVGNFVAIEKFFLQRE